MNHQLGFLPVVPAVIAGAGAVAGYKTANALNPTNPRNLYLIGAAALVLVLVMRR
ncbi:MAG TPA: hypothetical protein VFZ38_19365 [Vicinamibacterales bacterium]